MRVNVDTLFTRSPEIPAEVESEVNKVYPKKYLFGSRRMANYWGFSHKVGPETDWDFAFPYEGSEQEEVRKMTYLGWVEKPTEKYKDTMHFTTWEKCVGPHKVQMCSKINLRLFKSVFDSLEPVFYWTYLHKSSPSVLTKEDQTAVFNQLYKTAGW